MRLTAWEEERLLIFAAAELARRHRDAGVLLNAPEAIAVICDDMLEAARAGASYEDVEAAGRAAVAPDEVLNGVAALVDRVVVEVLMDDGTRLVVLLEPIGPARDVGPGAIRPASDSGNPADLAGTPEPAVERLVLAVRSTSNRVVRVSSHYPFERVNHRLEFDRAAAAGYRLDLPAGSTARFEPGEIRTVVLRRVR